MALFQNKSNGKSGANELKKLKRQDVLELLLEQMHEGDDLRNAVARLEIEVEGLKDLAERLKDKLNLKDEQIEHLKDKLNHKDEQRDYLTAKLDDKDAMIERLKKRLDIKDKMIAELMAQGRELPHSDDLFDMAELLEVEERAVEAYINLENEAHAVEDVPAEDAADTDGVAPAADEALVDETTADETIAADDDAPAEEGAPDEKPEGEAS